MTIDRDEYIADQEAIVRCLDRLLQALTPMVQAANTRDEVAVGAKVQQALQNLADARREIQKLALRPRMSTLLEDWTEDELDVLREKLGMVPADDDEEDD